MTATSPDATGERTTTSSSSTGKKTLPGVFGPIPAELVVDPDRAHPLTADVPLKPGRMYWRDLVATLDPVADAAEIHRITAAFEFPWDYQRALELALYRTYCVPSVSAVLSEAGNFRDAPQQRYDDTALLMAELVEHGYDSMRGKESLRVINRQHAMYDITNDDMLYVLSTFVFEPLEWIDAHGWRRLHRTNASPRSTSIAGGAADEHRRHPGGHGSSGAGGTATRRASSGTRTPTTRSATTRSDLMCSWYPEAVRPWSGRSCSRSSTTTWRARSAYPRPSPALRSAGYAAVRARSRLIRWFPVRRKAYGTEEHREPDLSRLSDRLPARGPGGAPHHAAGPVGRRLSGSARGGGRRAGAGDDFQRPAGPAQVSDSPAAGPAQVAHSRGPARPAQVAHSPRSRPPPAHGLRIISEIWTACRRADGAQHADGGQSAEGSASGLTESRV